MLEQAFYGSWSGHDNFGILARSAGIGRGDADRIGYHSNLGGSAQTADDPPPVFCLFHLDGGKWAFSRTVFLGRARRGNDYLAHVFVLDDEAMQSLRGDVFLLEEEFASTKPEPGQELPALAVGAAANRAARRCGSGASKDFPLSGLPGILGTLAESVLALPAKDGGDGSTLCRSVLSVLPPDDRMRLSFCSRFAHPRGISFRLTAYDPADRELVARYLADFAPAAASRAQRSMTATPFEHWMELIRRGIDPLYRLSLLGQPEACVSLAASFLKWLQQQHAEPGPAPKGAAASELRPLLAVVNDERNRYLPQVQLILVDATLRGLEDRVSAALQGDSTTIEEAFRAIRRVPDPASTDRLLMAAQRAASTRDLEALTTAVAIALLVPASPPLNRIYGAASGALLAGSGPAADWIQQLHRRQPTVCLEILTFWFTAWRREDATSCLGAAAQILCHLGQHGAADAALLTIAALEAASPGGDPRDRSEWLLALLRQTRPATRDVFPAAFAARIAVQERLLGNLDRDEMHDLAEPLTTSFPEAVGEQLDWHSLPYPIVKELLAACRRGFAEPPATGGWSDICERPARWQLASRVADAAAIGAAQIGDAPVLSELLRLLVAASRLVDADAGPIAEKAADTRMASALWSACAAGATGAMDDVVAAAVRFDAPPPDSISETALHRCFHESWRNAAESGPDRLLVTLLMSASLCGLFHSAGALDDYL